MRLPEVNAALRDLEPGGAVLFPLPVGQPERRIAYQRIGSVADHVLGVGRYRLQSTVAGVMVVHKRRFPMRGKSVSA